MSKNASVSTFILGGLCGAVLGILFAPRPGYETREILVDRALDYWDNADEFYGAASDRAVEIYSTSRDVAIDATEQVRAKIEAARTRLAEEVGNVAEKTAPQREALGAAGASALKSVKEAAARLRDDAVEAEQKIAAEIPHVEVEVEKPEAASAAKPAPAKPAAPKPAPKPAEHKAVEHKAVEHKPAEHKPAAKPAAEK